MQFLGRLRRLTPVQKNTFVACFLGWSLDAFDFFILVFCVSAISGDFHTKVSSVAEAIFITLRCGRWAHSCSAGWRTAMAEDLH